MRRLGYLVMALCLTVADARAFAQSADDLAALKKKAEALVDQQNFVDALPMFEKLVVAEPTNGTHFYYLGFSLLGQANNTRDDAERRALRVRARDAFVRSKALGCTESLLDPMIQSMPADGSDAPAFSENRAANDLMHAAEALFSQGKLDDALKIYQQAFVIDPVLYDAPLFAGDVCFRQGSFSAAETWYQKAIAIDPNCEIAYRYSATPLMRQQKYAEARDRYVEAYITEPYNKFAIMGLSDWGTVTKTDVAHPTIEVDETSPAWAAYTATRAAWSKEKFAAAFPAEPAYRHSLAEEAEALRAVVAAADKTTAAPSPSIATLKSLDADGLLEAYILLATADNGIAKDQPEYLRLHRDLLRRYVLQRVIAAGK